RSTSAPPGAGRTPPPGGSTCGPSPAATSTSPPAGGPCSPPCCAAWTRRWPAPPSPGRAPPDRRPPREETIPATNYYSPAAEFFDLVGHRHMATSAPALRAALTGLDTGHGTVLDIGAGTGLVTAAIADILPPPAIRSAAPPPATRPGLTSTARPNP